MKKNDVFRVEEIFSVKKLCFLCRKKYSTRKILSLSLGLGLGRGGLGLEWPRLGLVSVSDDEVSVSVSDDEAKTPSLPTT